jgi:hypothetical protein
MGFEFSLVLSREISKEESSDLLDSGCSGVVFTTDTLPTNAEVTVTKMDFDDTVSPSLAEAIESALEAVKKLPDLSASGLIVPAQPAERPAEDAPADVVTGKVVTAEVVTADEENGAEGAPKKASTRKTTARKTSARKAAAVSLG